MCASAAAEQAPRFQEKTFGKVVGLDGLCRLRILPDEVKRPFLQGCVVGERDCRLAARRNE
jgi:hypothetical protein